MTYGLNMYSPKQKAIYNL